MKYKFLLVIVCVLIWIPSQDASLHAADPLNEYLKAQTRYWGIEKTITEEDFNQLVGFKRRAEASGLSQEERSKAYSDLFQFVQKLRGVPQGRVPADMAASYWGPGQPAVPPIENVTKPRELGSFEKKGKGSIPMVLIPDIGADSSVFHSFMARHQNEFTFYAVTLPGFGGTSPPAAGTKLDFGKQGWWDNATAALLHFIEQENIHKPVLFGHQAGAYAAAKIALQYPEKVQGVIVLNGLLYAPVPGISAEASIAERTKIVNGWTPVELFPYPTQDQYQAMMLQRGEWFCKDKKRQSELAKMMARTTTRTWWNYFAELATTDLRNDINRLKVPMLVLPSIHDSASPGVETSKVALAQWTPLEQSKSSLPITVIPLENSRAYAMDDQPEKLGEAIRNWIRAR